MAIIGIGIGLFVFLFSAAFISEAVVHSSGAGIFPGLVLAIWAARPFLHRAHVERQNLLHPVPREYKVPAKVAFARIRDLLADASYNFGDRWHVATADTQTGRISASLRFTDEHTHWEADARGHIHTRKERQQRFIGLDIQVQDAGNGSTIIQLDFSPKTEGTNFFACDSIICSLAADIDRALGCGTQTTNKTEPTLGDPPLWLKALTAFAALGLCGDLLKSVLR